MDATSARSHQPTDHETTDPPAAVRSDPEDQRTTTVAHDAINKNSKNTVHDRTMKATLAPTIEEMEEMMQIIDEYKHGPLTKPLALCMRKILMFSTVEGYKRDIRTILESMLDKAIGHDLLITDPGESCLNIDAQPLTTDITKGMYVVVKRTSGEYNLGIVHCPRLHEADFSIVIINGILRTKFKVGFRRICDPASMFTPPQDLVKSLTDRVKTRQTEIARIEELLAL